MQLPHTNTLSPSKALQILPTFLTRVTCTPTNPTTIKHTSSTPLIFPFLTQNPLLFLYYPLSNSPTPFSTSCMDAPRGDGTSENRRKGVAKRSSTAEAAEAGDGAPPANAPCGACKFLRRKCVSGCIFAPHFGSDQGAARFAAVHKVFGASNVSKLLVHIPANRRHDAVVTISYEAQARLSDPVYGCVSTIIALQQQVASLQSELSLVQNQLINSRYVMANALQSSPPQHQHNLQQYQQLAMMQPAYSNNSSASNNLMSMHSFSPNFAETTAPSNSFEPIHHLSGRALHDEDEEEEESHDPIAFASHIFH